MLYGGWALSKELGSLETSLEGFQSVSWKWLENLH